MKGKVHMEVYIDILFIENLIINYGILKMTEIISNKKTTFLKKFLSSLIGSVYLIVMLLCPEFKSLYTITGKLVLSLLMIAVAFNAIKIKTFFKTLLSFYLATFLFAGVGYALLNISSQAIYIKNGVFYNYSKVSFLMLALATVFAFLMVRAFTDIFRKRVEDENLIVNASIKLGEKLITVPALIDTGNSLIDPVTRFPVMIVEFDTLKKLLPIDMVNWVQNWSEKPIELDNSNDLSYLNVEKTDWKKRLRLIPFNAIGTENGILPGFKPDGILFENDESRTFKTQVIIGIYIKRLSVKETYNAIIGPQLANQFQ